MACKKPVGKGLSLRLLCLFTAACDGDGSHETETYFENRSGHKVRVQPYNGGGIYESKVRILAVDEIQQVWGEKGRGPSIGSVYGELANDSIVVTFDDPLKVTHLGAMKGLLINTYPYEHPRNLLNRKNYTTTKLETSGKFVESEYRYIFTPEDYQDALRLNK